MTAHALDPVSIIVAKRDGRTLDDAQIRWFVEGFTDQTVAAEQMAALAMAVLWRGLDDRELSTWTAAMLDSGVGMDLGDLGRPTVDKHSTGGVGDKVSLVLCPLVAACGAAVPQLSGRGLGHTGGTLDKMEAIPGWSAVLTPDELRAQLAEVGAAIVAASDDLAPADRELYALRDVTGTVESIPLIASSIMSKKIAEGTDALVLDVKVGSGAFMKDADRARALADAMVRLGGDHGVATTALLTDMDVPLGRSAGNAVEVTEAVEVLDGGGPADLLEVTLALAAEMVALAGLDVDPADKLADGSARRVWDEMVSAQGGDPTAALREGRHGEELVAHRSGTVERLDALAVGVAAWRLGAGRARRSEAVQAGAGVRWWCQPGDEVRVGDVLAELRTDDPGRLAGARQALSAGIVVGDGPPSRRGPIVLDRLGP